MGKKVLGFRIEVLLVESGDGFDLAAPLRVCVEGCFQGLFEVSGDLLEVVAGTIVCGGVCWRRKKPDCTG